MMFKDRLNDLILKTYNESSYDISNPLLNSKINGINKGDYMLVGGLPGSGKRSFVDNYFLIDMLRKWDKKTAEEKEQEPLKIIYFSTKYKKDYKFIKWGCALHFNTSGNIIDIPTIKNSSGKLFEMKAIDYEKYIDSTDLLEKAFEAEVLTFIDTNVTLVTLDKTLNGFAQDFGELEYRDNGEMEYTLHKEEENLKVIVIVDDINNVRSGPSSYGEGFAKKDEVNSEVNKILKKYSSIGFSIVAINTSAYSKFSKKYVPSTNEVAGFSPNKCIIMYNTFQEKVKNHIGFESLDFVDEYGVNRLRFAYIAYNEVGISNFNIPLLFIPENGKFVPLEMGEGTMDTNIARFNNIVKLRDKIK